MPSDRRDSEQARGSGRRLNPDDEPEESRGGRSRAIHRSTSLQQQPRSRSRSNLSRQDTSGHRVRFSISSSSNGVRSGDGGSNENNQSGNARGRSLAESSTTGLRGSASDAEVDDDDDDDEEAGENASAADDYSEEYEVFYERVEQVENDEDEEKLESEDDEEGETEERDDSSDDELESVPSVRSVESEEEDETDVEEVNESDEEEDENDEGASSVDDSVDGGTEGAEENDDDYDDDETAAAAAAAAALSRISGWVDLANRLIARHNGDGGVVEGDGDDGDVEGDDDDGDVEGYDDDFFAEDDDYFLVAVRNGIDDDEEDPVPVETADFLPEMGDFDDPFRIETAYQRLGEYTTVRMQLDPDNLETLSAMIDARNDEDGEKKIRDRLHEVIHGRPIRATEWRLLTTRRYRDIKGNHDGGQRRGSGDPEMPPSCSTSTSAQASSPPSAPSKGVGEGIRGVTKGDDAARNNAENPLASASSWIGPFWWRTSAPSTSAAVMNNAAPAASEGSESIDCAVCLERFLNADVVTRLHCGHLLHSACARKALREKACCPLCRGCAVCSRPDSFEVICITEKFEGEEEREE